MSSSFDLSSCVRGYHVYQQIWTAVPDETLHCSRETSNRTDFFAVAVLKNDEVVGHVPRRDACVASLFIRNGGSVLCRITGTRQYSGDIPQGGLEVPCVYTFTGINNLVSKSVQRLDELNIQVQLATRENFDSDLQSNVCAPDEDTGTESGHFSPRFLQSSLTVRNDVDMDDSVWTEVLDIMLTERDKQVITNGQNLTDKHINYSQRLIHQQFKMFSGLQLTVLQQKPFKGEKCNYMQIVHIRGNHWILVSSTEGKAVNVYDSLYALLDKEFTEMIQTLLKCSSNDINMIPVQRKIGINDCGLFAIAFATAIAFDRDPRKEVFDQKRMRDHLIQCFENMKMECFP